jgi:AraC family transcriptional regulator
MTEKHAAQPMSALYYAFAGGNVLLSSERAGWAGLTAKYYRGPRDYASSVPAFREDLIAIVIHDSTDVSGKLVRQFRQIHSVPGSSYAIPKGEPSEWHGSGACEVLHLYLDPRFFATIAVEATDIDPARIELIARINQQDALVYQIGLALLGELQSSRPHSRLYAEALGQALAVHLLRHHIVFPQLVDEPKGGLNQPVLRAVLAYIEEHLAHELALAEIAGQARMSQYHFARLFRQSMGCSLHQYVTEQRLERAKALLIGGKHSIAEVAALTGFVDQSHLHRYFKRRYGVTPGAALGRSTNIQSTRTNIQDEIATDPLG